MVGLLVDTEPIPWITATMQRLTARLLACAAIGAAGCVVPPPPQEERGRAPEVLLAYRDQVQSHTRELATLVDAAPASGLATVFENIESSRTAAEGFRDALYRYECADGEVRGSAAADGLRALQASIAGCEDAREEAGRRAVELSRFADSAQTRYERHRLAKDAGGPPVDQRRAQEYVAACLMLARLAAEVDGYLADIHADRLRSASDSGHPVPVVLHFLRLHALRPEKAAELSPRYSNACRAWFLQEVQADRLAAALRIFQFLFKATPRERRPSLQEVRTIADVCLDRSPSLDVLAEIEAAFSDVHAFVVSDPEGKENAKRELEMARASLVLARAIRVENPAERADLAVAALAGNPHLSTRVAVCLERAAREIGESHLAARRYVEAVPAFRDTLARGPVDRQEERVAQFRAGALTQVLGAFREALAASRFDAAKSFLADADRVAGTEEERGSARDALHDYHARRTAHLFERDVRASIAACREAQQFFPDDRGFQETIDRGLFQLLRQDVGDPATSCRRLGAEKILAMVRAAVQEMRGRSSAERCQQLLEDHATAWKGRMTETEDPTEAFAIALELAKLNRRDVASAKQEGARVLQERLDRAVRRGDWAQAERSIDAYFASCPEIQRPPEFKAQYIRLLVHLDGKADLRSLARQLTIFTRAYPHDWRAVRPLVVKHIAGDDPQCGTFRALLALIDPQSAELRMAAAAAAAAPSGSEPAEPLPDAVGDRSPSETATWWVEPEPPSKTATAVANSQTASPSAARGFGTLSIAGALIGGIGTAAYVAVLAFLSLRRGLLAFRWYAAAALCAGLTVGFVIGARDSADRDIASAAPTAGARSGNAMPWK